MSIAIDTSNGKTHYDINYDSQVFLELLQQQDQPIAGTVSVGERKPMDESDLWVRGHLSQVDGRHWWQVIQQYQHFGQQITTLNEDGQQPGSAAPLLRLGLTIDDLSWDELSLENLQLSGGQNQEGWRFEVDNTRVVGSVTLYDDERPMALSATLIDWQLSDESETALSHSGFSGSPAPKTLHDMQMPQDPLQAIFPEDLISADIDIQQLMVDNNDFGSWSFKLRPQGDQLLVEDIVGEIRGMRVGSADNGSRLVWKKPKMVCLDPRSSDCTRGEQTQILASIRGKNLASVSDAWNLPRLLESKSTSIDANFTWPGSPAIARLEALEGSLALKIKDGRFYQSTGQASTAFLRLVGLFNFDSWVRRLQFDFTDVVGSGMPFERVEGSMKFDRGSIYLTRPLRVENPSSEMQMGGQIDLLNETLDTSLVVTLPVGGNATLLTALAAGLPAAAGVYIASKIFRKQVQRVASLSYEMVGPWSDPNITFNRLFDDKAAKKASKKSRKASEQIVPEEIPSTNKGTTQ